ncbi:MAG TPA: M23 family metallopeptidase [Polyangia bacterium]|jgi:murein DD-endopeptidase MepM/ murein hydrolase activator NlpD|nr:M23 family metallopeptidase [Polyangia bacterium]
MRQVTRHAVLLVALLAAPAASAHARPWEAREPSVEPKPAHQLKNPATWPAEPDAPVAPIDAAKFAAAWAYLCEVAPESTTAALAPKILAAASAAKSDPFTLAALARFSSHCDAAYKAKKGSAYGLLGIEPSMYRTEGAPDLPVDKSDLTLKKLLDPDVNLAVGAALLEMWNAAHKELDGSFGGGSHRSGVSHFIWGDVVRSSGQEDLVLTARRRMILNYLGNKDTPRPASYVGINVVSPLDAVPRVATSGPGDDRSGGARRHAGLDITGMVGEPVRAIADGTVIFAGVNSPNKSRMSGIPPEKIRRYRYRRMGVGGIYVCIEHTPEPKKVVSCYMHLNSYNVNERDEVKAGQVIGELGRTGVKISPPHLHLEVRIGERHTNPLRTLGDMMIPPKATMTHQYNVRAQRARLRALRS